eukprot:scaffold111754_cov19-Tisochrysis_lutea.AAC.2
MGKMSKACMPYGAGLNCEYVFWAKSCTSRISAWARPTVLVSALNAFHFLVFTQPVFAAHSVTSGVRVRMHMLCFGFLDKCIAIKASHPVPVLLLRKHVNKSKASVHPQTTSDESITPCPCAFASVVTGAIQWGSIATIGASGGLCAATAIALSPGWAGPACVAGILRSFGHLQVGCRIGQAWLLGWQASNAALAYLTFEQARPICFWQANRDCRASTDVFPGASQMLMDVHTGPGVHAPQAASIPGHYSEVSAS